MEDDIRISPLRLGSWRVTRKSIVWVISTFKFVFASILLVHCSGGGLLLTRPKSNQKGVGDLRFRTSLYSSRFLNVAARSRTSLSSASSAHPGPYIHGKLPGNQAKPSVGDRFFPSWNRVKGRADLPLLIKPDVKFSLIRLSDILHLQHSNTSASLCKPLSFSN